MAPVFRPGKTKQDKQPVEQRQRVKEADARRLLPSNERKSTGAVVKWTDGGPHVGRITKVEGDEITVEYGSAGKHGKRTLDASELTVVG